MDQTDAYSGKSYALPGNGGVILEQSRNEAEMGIIRPLSDVLNDVIEWEEAWNTQNM